MAKSPVALITGTSSGFGMLTSAALAAENYRVVAAMRDSEKKDRLLATAEKKNAADSIEIVEMDVTDHSRVAEVVDEVVQRHGKIDVLINNAGFAMGGFVEEVAMEDWRRQFETNFFGLVAVTKAVLPYMRQRKRGKIINISSISGRFGFPAMGPYVASKYAVEGFSESLRLEMAPFGVHVVLIEPGSYKTDIWDKGLNSIEENPDSPYADKTKTLLKYVDVISKTAQNPDEVVRTILRAVKSPYPTLRYPVGRGVHSGLLVKQMVPWRPLERIITRRF